MINQFDNQLYISAYLWTQWKIQYYGQAYFNVTTPLYYTPDPALPSTWIGYSAPFASWIYDSGISGAVIIQSVSGAGFSAPLNRASGINIDYTNGRVIVPASFGTTLSLTGTYAAQEVNVYQPNESQEQILTQGRFYQNPNYNGQATGGAPPNTYCTPAVFINTLHDDNQAFALGGLIDCTSTYSLVVYANSNYQLNALLSIFRDTKYQYIPLLTVPDDPLNGFGDTKSGYNYLQYIQQYGTPGNLVYIKEVKTAKVSDKVKMNPQYFVGLVDITMSFIRIAPIQPNSFT